mmetsp:Transcript_25630/g.74092  ORF Transcript_25630/g.74092 Transcript_25630/m.74092 type:complete len:229 (+) Transcript_25630:583-1269(+)
MPNHIVIKLFNALMLLQCLVKGLCPASDADGHRWDVLWTCQDTLKRLEGWQAGGKGCSLHDLNRIDLHVPGGMHLRNTLAGAHLPDAHTVSRTAGGSLAGVDVQVAAENGAGVANKGAITFGGTCGRAEGDQVAAAERAEDLGTTWASAEAMHRRGQGARGDLPPRPHIPEPHRSVQAARDHRPPCTTPRQQRQRTDGERVTGPTVKRPRSLLLEDVCQIEDMHVRVC